MTTIIATSYGINHSAEWLNTYREHRQKVRSSIQAKADTSKRSTKRNARKLLKRLSGRERRFVSINNHTIAKQIVAKAKEENKGIAIEDLSKIRKTAKTKSKQQKTELNRWAFYQLRHFLTYKSVLSGVKLFAVPAPYTSQTCNLCNHIGERNGKHFSCTNCGNKDDADINAALNISAWGVAVNTPEKSTMYCSLHSLVRFKASMPLG